MATDIGQVSPEMPVSNRADRFIESELSQTSRRLRYADIAWALLLTLAWLLASLLLCMVVDAWVMELGSTARLAGLIAILAVAIGIFVWAALPPLIRRVNPQFVAQMIEHSGDSLHNSLLNYLLVSNRKDQTRGSIYELISGRAARDLATIEEDRRVDFSRAIRMGLAVAALVAAFAGYLAFSPKSGWTSLGRVLAPGARIAPAARVSISNVTPGDITVFYGEKVPVSCEVRGLKTGNPVQLVFSARDGHLRDVRVPLQPDSSNSLVWRGELGGTEGVDSDLVYAIQAGDGTSPQYEVLVRPNPTISIQSVEVQPPEYTKLPLNIHRGRGEIRAPEGSKVRIVATTNQDIRLAWIELVNAGSAGTLAANSPDIAVVQSIEMKTDGERSASGEFQLLLDRGRQQQTYSHYRLRFRNRQDQRNEVASLHPVVIIPDLAPEVSIVRPEKTPIEVPENGALSIEVQAADVDYEISELELVIDHQGSRLLDKTLALPQERDPQKVSGRYRLVPSEHGLKAGSEVVFFARALDNRVSPHSYAKDPNESLTAPYTVKIVAAREQANETPEQSSTPNSSQQGADPGDPSKPEPGQRDNRDQNRQPTPADPENRNAAKPNESSENRDSPPSGTDKTPGSQNPQPQQPPSGSGNEGDQQSNQSPEGAETGDNPGGSQSGSEQGKEQGDEQGKESAGDPGEKSGNQSDSGSSQSSGQTGDSQTGTSTDKPGQSKPGQSGSSKSGEGASSESSEPGQGSSEAGENSSSPQPGGGSSEGSRAADQGGANDPNGQAGTGSANTSGDEGADGQSGGRSESADSQTDSQSNSTGSNGSSEDPESGSAGGGGSRDSSLRDGKRQSLGDDATDSERFDAIQDFLNEEQDAPDSKGSSGASANSRSESPSGEGDPSGAAGASRQDSGSAGNSGQSEPQSPQGRDSGNVDSPGSDSGDRNPDAGNNSSGSADSGGKSEPSADSQNPSGTGADATGEEQPKTGDRNPSGSSEKEGSQAGEKRSEAGGSGQQGAGNPETNDSSEEKGTGRNQEETTSGTGEGKEKSSATGDDNSAATEDSRSADPPEGGKTPGENDAEETGGGKESGRSGESSSSPMDESAEASSAEGESSAGSKESDGASSEKDSQSGGSQSSSSQQPPGGAKSSDQPASEQGSASGEGSDSGEGSESGKESSKEGGTSSASSSQSSTASAASADNNSAQSGGATRGGGGGAGAAGGSPADSGGPSPDQARQIEYNRAATDLLLDKLEAQRENPDRELLERMNWTEEDLRDFLDRWKQMKAAAGSGDEAARRRYNEALKGARLPSQAGKARSVQTTGASAEGLSEDGGVNRPPADLVPEFNAFMKQRARQDRQSGGR